MSERKCENQPSNIKASGNRVCKNSNKNEAVKLTSKNHDKAPNEMRDNNGMVENAE